MKLVKNPNKVEGEGWMFKPVNRPSFTDALSFPDDLTKLSLGDVSCLHGQYTALLAYAIAETTKADIEALRLRSQCMKRKNDITRTGTTYNWKKNQIDLQVRLDKRMEDFELASHKVEEVQLLRRSYVEIFEKYVAALSREMTRRMSEQQRNGA